MNDRDAIEKTLAGDINAFGALVSRYQAKACVVALSRVYDVQGRAWNTILLRARP